jgi:hypothetical protein
MELVLTKNFYNWMRTVLLGGNPSFTTTDSNGLHTRVKAIGEMKTTNEAKVVELSNVSDYGAREFTLLSWGKSTQDKYSTRFLIGRDKTEATENDYRLGDALVKDTDYKISFYASEYPTILESGKTNLTFVVIITVPENNQPISVGEIGLFKGFYCTTGTSSAGYNDVLLGRIALEKPIPLSAGESATFQVSVEI